MYKNIRQFNSKPPVEIDYRVMNDSTMDIIYQRFSRDNHCDFVESIEYIDIDESISLLHSKKILQINFHYPIEKKYISPKDSIKPWINQSIKTEMKKTTVLYATFQRQLNNQNRL